VAVLRRAAVRDRRDFVHPMKARFVRPDFIPDGNHFIVDRV
jgi:hypothetical protein